MPRSRAIPSDKARREWGELLDLVQSGTIVTITRHGRPVAIMLSAEEYEQLREQSRLSREIAEEQRRE